MMLEAIGSLTTVRTGGPTATDAASAATPGRAVAGTAFADVFADISGQAVGTLKTAEAASISGIQGKTSIQNVVQTIMAAEETLQTALAVRDKVVAAYQEISRMAI